VIALLYFVGLGLSSKDISLKALDVLKRADRIYVDNYTSLFVNSDFKVVLSEYVDQAKVSFVDREFLEGEDYRRILKEAALRDIVIAVIGDPFIATTHIFIRIEAEKAGIPTKVIHAPSILSAGISATGLQAYKFGKSATIVFPEEEFFSTYPYEVLYDNLLRGLHTFFFLDIKVERSRLMRVEDALKLLLRMEEFENKGIIDLGALGIGLGRIGSDNEVIRAGSFKDLLQYNFGPPPHSLIIPGDLHPLEEEVLIYICGAPKTVVKHWSSRVKKLRSKST